MALPILLSHDVRWIENRRQEANAVVRALTAILYGFTAMLIAGSGALMISTERERDTWDGLIVTPLEPKQIILQKMLGAIYQQRWMLVPMGIVWFTGLATRGLSWLAAMLVLCEFAVFFGFSSAVGVWSSLFAKGTSKASSWAGGIVLLVNLSGILIALALKNDSIVFATLCTPVIVSLSLFRNGTDPGLLMRQTFDDTLLGEFTTVVICLFCVVFYAGATLLMTWDSIRRFDSAVGRPRREIDPIPIAEPHAISRLDTIPQ